MSEYIHPFRDSTLNLDQAYTYNLLLLVDRETFSYAVVYKDMLLAYDYDCNINELNEPRQLQELLTAAYKKVTVGFVDSGFVLVPRHLFSTEQIPNVARLLNVQEEEQVLAQVVDGLMFAVYKVHEKSVGAVSNFRSKDVVFTGQGVIKALLNSRPANNNLYVNVLPGKIEILHFKGNALDFFNGFTYQSTDDAVYYIALVMQQLNMRLQETVLMLSGIVEPGEPLHSHLKAFFPKVDMSKVQLMELPVQLPSYKVLSLASLMLCGSSEEA